MSTTRAGITMDEALVVRLDRLVSEQRFPSRSRAIQEVVQEKLARMDRSRLARESAKLDPSFERDLAEEFLAEELEWPEY